MLSLTYRPNLIFWKVIGSAALFTSMNNLIWQYFCALFQGATGLGGRAGAFLFKCSCLKRCTMEKSLHGAKIWSEPNLQSMQSCFWFSYLQSSLGAVSTEFPLVCDGVLSCVVLWELLPSQLNHTLPKGKVQDFLQSTCSTALINRYSVGVCWLIVDFSLLLFFL